MIEAGIWQHYKGGYYQVLGVAAHSETDELMVVYVSLSGAHLPGPRMRVRPLAEWHQVLNDFGIETIFNGQPRFRYIGLEIPETERQQVNLQATICTRDHGHDGPCNGYPRASCVNKANIL